MESPVKSPMMDSPIDLTNLRSMTDGDKEMEKALFEEFFTSFETGINTLRGNCTKMDNEAWRTGAHALKGIAMNLGATELGGLCKQAQDSSQATAEAKNKMIELIAAEYQRVREYMLQIM